MNSVAKERMREIFPAAPDWLRYSESQRQMWVELQIKVNQLNGFNKNDAEVMALRDFGYTSAGEYWSDRLSEPMKAKDYINLLIDHIKLVKENGIGPALMYQKAFDLAQDMGESWFLDGPRHNSLLVQPLHASKWLLSMPRQRHLVPETLARFLTGDEACIEVSTPTRVAHQARKRGRPPVVRENSIIAMRTLLVNGAITRDDLRNMTEKELAYHFGASRDVLRGVRDTVLSENVENAIPAIYSTNDK